MKVSINMSEQKHHPATTALMKRAQDMDRQASYAARTDPSEAEEYRVEAQTARNLAAVITTANQALLDGKEKVRQLQAELDKHVDQAKHTIKF